MRKKVIALFVILMMLVTMLPSTIAFADGEEMSPEFKALLNEDGKYVIHAVKPQTEDDVIEMIYNGVVALSKYKVAAQNYDAETQTADIIRLDEMGAPVETHNIEVVFQYEDGIYTEAQAIMNAIPSRDDEKPYFFAVSDMELINYWVSRSGDEFTDEMGGGLDNYSGELKQYLNYQNYKLYVDNLAGMDSNFMTERLGMAYLLHKGSAYAYDATIGTRAKHIIYVSEETGSSKEALLEAVQKRIDAYIGAGKITVTAGEESVYELETGYYTYQIEYATARYNEAKSAYDSLKPSVDASLQAIDARRTELNTLLTAAREGLNEKWDLKENMLPISISNLESRIVSIQTNKDVAHQTLIDAKDELIRQRDEIQDTESEEYQNLQVQIDAKLLEIEKYTNGLTEYDTDMAECQAELVDLNAQLEAARLAYNELEIQVNNYEMELNALNGGSHQLVYEYNNLNSNLVQYEMNCKDALKQKASAEAEKDYFDENYNNPEGEYYYLQQAEGGYYFLAELEYSMYAFFVVKDSSKMLNPTAVSVDANTNVAVSTDDTSIPLDTMVTVEKLSEGETYDKIIKTLGVKDNATFDITLFSDTLNKNITKLEDGTFSVKIPVPAELNGKELIAYYVDANDKVTEYPVSVKDGYAAFTTDHFSIYTIAEKLTENETGSDTSTDTTPDEEPDTDTTTPSEPSTPAVDTTVSTADGKNSFEVKAEAGVMPEGSKLVVENVTAKKEVYESVGKLLINDIKADKYQIFDITLVDASNKPTQPEGVIEVTTTIPEGYDVNSLVVYRVSEDGTKTLVKTSIDVKAKTITLYLDHFSTYVIAEKIAVLPQQGDTSFTMLWVAMIVLGGISVVYGVKKYNFI